MQKRIKQAQKYLEWEEPNQAIAELRTILNGGKVQKEYVWVPNHMMGIALSLKGEHESSARYLEKAVKHGSEQPETYHMLSVNYYNLGQLDEAENYGKEAVERKEDFLKGWLNLGSVYRAQAKLDEALQCYQKANQLDPKNAGVALRIGEIYRDQGDLEQAMKLFDITLKIDKDHKHAILEKADIYKKNGNFKEAKKWLTEAKGRYNDLTPIEVSEAELYKSEGDYDKAIHLYEKLLQQKPGSGALRVNYALCLQEVSRFDQSEKHYRRAIEDVEDPKNAISNYLMGLHYNPENSREYIFKEHVRLGKEFIPDENRVVTVSPDTEKDKQLKIGFVSGGFRRHPVGWMIAGALEQLPENDFELYCYTTNNKYDFVTRRIHQHIDVWRSVVGYKSDVIESLIREDELDILVDLSGHSADNCLDVMSRKPAPIIVKWVGGLFNTTGLEAFDYLISDWHESPQGEEPYYTEKLVRLPDDYITFTPPAYAPDVGELPVKKNGCLTFGCFNNPTKVNQVVLKQWAGIMREVPDSHLFLKSKQYDTPSFRDQITAVMKEQGISGDRIEFQGHTSHDEHLEAYNRLDIALDPWPYSGGLTTCEALYMGVPVITMPGPTFAGRHSATHLVNAGLSQWVTDSWEEYAEKVEALTKDQDTLRAARQSLREQLLSSPVCDGKRFGAHLSVAFRQMWEQRVKGYKNDDQEWQDHIAVEPLSDAKINKLTDGPIKTPLITINDREDKVEESISVNKETPKVGEDILSKGIVEESISGTKELVKDMEKREGQNNGMTENGRAVNEQSKNEREDDTYYIETKDKVTVCTPADLDLLTPYVLLEQEEWFEPELDFIRQYLQPGMNVIDAGAAFGAYALPMAKLVGKEGTVYAFEPGSVAQKHLEISKLENGLEQLEILARGLGTKAGKAKLKKAETPELNAVAEEGQEGIMLTTLDAWWYFAGQPKLDLLKIDVNGVEPEVLKGSTEMLEEAAPVILASIGESEDSLSLLHNQLQKMSYKLFEYIPGPGLLAEHDQETGVDPYLMNIIAVNESRIDEFKKAGWVFDESVTPEKPEKALWKETLSALPWTNSLMSDWEEKIASGAAAEYLQVLNMICVAEQMDVSAGDAQSRSRKGATMLTAAQKLIGLFNSGQAGIATAMTYVRVMNQLGKRGQAVEMMKELMETVNSGNDISVDMPFFLPLPDQDHTDIQTDFSKWLTVRIVESWIMLKDPTTHMSSEQERKMLQALEENPEVMEFTERQITLLAMKNGDKVNIDQQSLVQYAVFEKRHQSLYDVKVPQQEKSGNKIFNDSFWNGTLDQIKAKRIVEFTNKFFSSEYSNLVLQQIVDETEDRHNRVEDDNIAFFIQVHALLAMDNDGKENHELNQVLEEKGWQQKQALYSYWFEDVKFLRGVENPQVSAVVIIDKYKEKTVENLKSLQQQLEGKGEIIFVSNGVDKKQLEPLMEYIDTYVRLNGNSGAYLARNIGALFGKGELLLFVDDDGIPDEGMIQAHIDVHHNRDILVSRGVCYSDDRESDPWHYDLGSDIRPAVTFIEGNTMYRTKEFYQVDGWGDYILFGHGGMELSYRLLSLNDDKRKQVYIPNARLQHNYNKKGSSQKDKAGKQLYSSYLLNAKHNKLNKAIKVWPEKFEGIKDKKIKKNSINLPPSDVKIVRFSEQSRAINFDIAIPKDEIHRIGNIFKKSEYSLPESANMGDDLTVVDVGANVGVFALYSQLFGRNVDVFCFEPNPQVLSLLERNTNGIPNIKIFNTALGASSGTLTLYQHPLNTGQASTTFHFDGAEKVEVPVRNSGKMLQKELGIKKIDVLKIDTEGAEVSILKGMQDLLSDTKIIMAEYHTEYDRKKIEEMLTDFILYSAEVQELRGVGTVKYANRKFF